MHNGGWRVSSKKAGLADLKRLAYEAAARPAPAPSAAPRGTAGGATTQHARDPSPATPLSAQEIALFKRLAGAVAPVNTRNRVLHTPAPSGMLAGKPPNTPARAGDKSARSSADARRTAGAPAAGSPAAGSPTAGDPPADAGLSDGDVSHLLCESGTAYVRPGIGPDVLKKLSQRFWRLEADLDLHGMTIDQARPRLAAFITQCVAYDARCVRVVHGKGYGSPDARPVLRDKVRAWLVGSADVRAFAQAPERDGGAGATVVLLNIDDRRARDRRAP